MCVLWQFHCLQNKFVDNSVKNHVLSDDSDVCEIGMGHADESSNTLPEWSHQYSGRGPMSGC